MKKPTHLFELGRIVATPGILRAAEEHGVSLLQLLKRHVEGDWGIVCEEDKKANEEAIRQSLRILSAYMIGDTKVYIITEWDRSYTTLMISSEY